MSLTSYNAGVMFGGMGSDSGLITSCSGRPLRLVRVRLNVVGIIKSQGMVVLSGLFLPRLLNSFFNILNYNIRCNY